MINEVIISKLNEIVGDFDSPFFNYLLYSYDLSLNDCEFIIEEIKNDEDINADNLVHVIDQFFKGKVIELEKQDKIEYLNSLLDRKSEYFIKYLEKYNLNDSQINLIEDKVKSKISDENITDFEIKRLIRYYFENFIKQKAYISELENIVGKNYDTLYIDKALKDNPILLKGDIYQIITHIHSEILDAREFKKGIRHEFYRQSMFRSESKKAQARKSLMNFVEGSGDSFSKLVEFKGLTKREGEAIVLDIMEDINAGLIQPDKVDSVFLTNRFNEYCEHER